jgi:hypothetical protein
MVLWITQIDAYNQVVGFTQTDTNWNPQLTGCSQQSFTAGSETFYPFSPITMQWSQFPVPWQPSSLTIAIATYPSEGSNSYVCSVGPTTDDQDNDYLQITLNGTAQMPVFLGPRGSGYNKNMTCTLTLATDGTIFFSDYNPSLP